MKQFPASEILNLLLIEFSGCCVGVLPKFSVPNRHCGFVTKVQWAEGGPAPPGELKAQTSSEYQCNPSEFKSFLEETLLRIFFPVLDRKI